MQYSPDQSFRADTDRMNLRQKAANSGGNRSARLVLIAMAASFLIGAALVGYLGYNFYAPEQAPTAGSDTKEARPSILDGLTSPTPSPTATAADAADTETDNAVAVQAVERVEEQQGGIDQRLAAAEQRLARLDLQAQAAAGNAARAEGLLIAFATRRAMERGTELGYLADQLRLRFGDALPNAVGTIIRTSRDPVTKDRLLAQLEGLGPALSQRQNEPTWAGFKREIGALFVVRRETSPSPKAERRLQRAEFFLESGRIDSAVAEVRNLPGAERARPWIAEAQRYAESQRALDLIETAAVLEPRRLRDGAGNRIGQASPAEDPTAN